MTLMSGYGNRSATSTVSIVVDVQDREERSKRGVLVAITLSAIAHLLAISLPMPQRSVGASAPPAAQLIELVEPVPVPTPVPPSETETETEDPAPDLSRAPQVSSGAGDGVSSTRTKRHRRHEAAAQPALALAAPTKAHQSDRTIRVEPSHEREEPEAMEGIDLPSPEEFARRAAVAPLVGLDDEGQMLRRVEQRGDGMLRDALPPRLNDPPAYPELILDDEGNFTWHFYYLVAKIRPDGSVFFTHQAPSKGFTGRYCHELATEPGQCEEIPTIPWPAGENPIGRFPENPIKRWFLRRTEALRDQMIDLDRRQTLATAPSAALRNVTKTWSDDSINVTARRRLLFELWDECEEPRNGDDERPEARVGQRAREHILLFIRRELPRGCSEAYSGAELRAYNAMRASRQPFFPYREQEQR